MSARIDKWLWHARLYKTRAQAAKSVTGGRVHVNGERVKPSRLVAPGDVIDLTRGQDAYRLTVNTIPRRRGPAAEAQSCYAEDELSRELRLRRASVLKQDRAMMPTTPGRPDKHTRRRLREIGRKSAN